MPAQKVERRREQRAQRAFDGLLATLATNPVGVVGLVTTAQVPINKFCLWYAFEKYSNSNNKDNKTRAPF